ncbi:MAG: sensor histidine kinase [Mycoplasma sp.]
MEEGNRINLNNEAFKNISIHDILKSSNDPIFIIDNKNNIYTNEDILARIWPSDNLLIKNRILKLSKWRLKNISINESHYLIDYYDIKSNDYLIIIMRDISQYHYDKKITRHEIKNNLQNILIEIDSNNVDSTIKDNISFHIKKIDEYLNNSGKIELNIENVDLKIFEKQLFQSINNEKYELIITNKLNINNWFFDKNKIEHAIKNAVLNSFHHAAVNKVNLDITTDSKYLHFSIIDLGKGIDQISLNDVKQGHNNIGFDLINNIIEAHKNKNGEAGFLTINSKKDVGTLVKISIPNMNKITKNYKTMYNINEI